MTSRGPGGKIPPQGRPPQAPGVGKTAKRHDLERPATPGLQNSDLQQGDVSRLESAQKTAPIGKRTQAAARPQGQAGQARPQRGGGVEVPPDPLDFIIGRGAGTFDPATQGIGTDEPIDKEKWAPLLREFARDPGVSGPLTTTLLANMSNLGNIPRSVNVRVIDQNAADTALEQDLL